MLRSTSAVILLFRSTWRNVFSCLGFRLAGNAFTVTALVLLSWPGIAIAQSSFEDGRHASLCQYGRPRAIPCSRRSWTPIRMNRLDRMV
jgi:hypothetical protein